MASKQAQSNESTVDVLKDLLTVELLLAGVPQRTVREIVRCDMNRVSAIGRALGGRKEALGK